MVFKLELGYFFLTTNSLVFLLSISYLAERIYSKLALNMLIFLGVILNCCFMSSNLFIFFLFFEITVIPLFFFLGIWGSRSRKLHAAYQFLLFTILSSICLIVAIMIIFISVGSLNFQDFSYIYLKNEDNIMICFLFFFSFAIKIPSLPLYGWLPEAHVESPTIASVILAAMILKLSFIGFYRTLPFYYYFESIFFTRPFFLTIFIISATYCSIIAIRQVDLKKIVAYSSIVHTNFSMIGLWTGNQLGVFGCVLGMLGHCFISAGLFFGVGFLYDRFHIRNILYYGGIVQYMPILSSLFFIFVLANMSLPLTIGFWCELLVMFALLEIANLVTLILNMFSFIFTGLYCINLAGLVLFRSISGFLKNNLRDVHFNEFYILLILLIFILFIGVYPSLINLPSC